MEPIATHPIIIISTQKNTHIVKIPAEDTHTEGQSNYRWGPKDSNKPVEEGHMAQHYVQPIEIQEEGVGMGFVLDQLGAGYLLAEYQHHYVQVQEVGDLIGVEDEWDDDAESQEEEEPLSLELRYTKVYAEEYKDVA